MTNDERRLLVASWCTAAAAMAVARGEDVDASEVDELVDPCTDICKSLVESLPPRSADGTIPVALDPGASAPTRANPADAGLDLRVVEACSVPARGSRVVRTGTHVQLPPGTCGLVLGRSGLNINHGVAVFPLVVDEGFSGEVKQRVYNFGDEAYRIEAGDRVVQIVVLPCDRPAPAIVDEVAGGERGDCGYGSTGR